MDSNWQFKRKLKRMPDDYIWDFLEEKKLSPLKQPGFIPVNIHVQNEHYFFKLFLLNP